MLIVLTILNLQKKNARSAENQPLLSLGGRVMTRIIISVMSAAQYGVLKDPKTSAQICDPWSRKINVNNPQESPAILSLCTGYGGIERGLELAGLTPRILAHVEIEAFAIANLVAKMEEGKLAPAPIWTDLKTLPAATFRGNVDILTGGYPCQPFSAAGKRMGEKDPRHLWPYITRIIDKTLPRVCFFENVEGHISKGLREVLTDLESRGYQATWGIFSAEEVSLIHERKRVYICNVWEGKPESLGRGLKVKVKEMVI